MKIGISISCVDGSEYFLGVAEGEKSIQSAAKRGLNFLEKYDHEGSSLSIKIELDDNEEVYNLLTKLQNL